MTKPWDNFFKQSITKIFTESKTVIDIGGGLRIDRKKNNRYDPNRSWIIPYAEKVNYKILDPVDTYHPDIIGDIHHLPFEDNSIDAIICIAVLEHVENPFRAIEEMRRSLKPGGLCFVYAPFLYYYHAETGYYKDYWRFSHDALSLLFKDFSLIQMQPVRGAIETLIRLSPPGRYKLFADFGYIADRLTGKIRSKQVSGYNVLATK